MLYAVADARARNRCPYIVIYKESKKYAKVKTKKTIVISREWTFFGKWKLYNIWHLGSSLNAKINRVDLEALRSTENVSCHSNVGYKLAGLHGCPQKKNSRGALQPIM